MRNIIQLFTPFAVALFLFQSTSFAANEAFTDVNEDDFAHLAIQYLVDEGIVKGYEDGSFKPDAKINRAEFLKIVLEAAKKDGKIEGEITGVNCFPDVKDQWFAPYVCSAKESGIINGYPDGKFYPEKEISFVEASKIIVNALKLEVDLENRENWYEAYVVSLEEKNAIPFSVVDFTYPITRADMACITSRISWSSGGNDCISDLTYSKVRGLSSLKGDKMKLPKIGNQVVTFYKVNNQVYIIDIYGEAYLLDKANPDTFKYLVGDLYYDNENVFNIYIDDLDPGELSSKITVVDKFNFDLSTLEPIKVETNTHWFLKDKDNLYLSCGSSDINNFLKVNGFDSQNFKVIGHFSYTPIFGYRTYFTDLNRLYASFSDPFSDYKCKIEALDVDLDSLEMVFDKPRDGKEYGDYVDIYSDLIFLKDKNHVYDPVKLSIVDWASPDDIQVWSIEYEDVFYYDEGKSFYYAISKDQIWIQNRKTGEFAVNNEIDAATFDFVGTFNYEATPFPGYSVRDDYVTYVQWCDEKIKETGQDLKSVEEDGTINSLLLNEDGTCYVRSLFPVENGEDTMAIFGFILKDKDQLWIFDALNLELNKLPSSVDLLSFEAVSLSHSGILNGLFKDTENVYLIKNNNLIVVEGMDTNTVEVVDDDNGGYLSDKNGKWVYDKDGVLKLN